MLEISKPLRFLRATSAFAITSPHSLQDRVYIIRAQWMFITHGLQVKEKPPHHIDKNMKVQKGEASCLWPSRTSLRAEPRPKADDGALSIGGPVIWGISPESLDTSKASVRTLESIFSVMINTLSSLWGPPSSQYHYRVTQRCPAWCLRLGSDALWL